MQIRVDDVTDPRIVALIEGHLAQMAELSPPESCHALDVAFLRKPDITFWSVWERDELLGCGALKELTVNHGEIKSMRTVVAHLRKGVAASMVRHILEEARRRGYRQLSLETGSQPEFEPARRLYAKYGFQVCEPFSSYSEDPNSVFMTLTL